MVPQAWQQTLLKWPTQELSVMAVHEPWCAPAKVSPPKQSAKLSGKLSCLHEDSGSPLPSVTSAIIKEKVLRARVPSALVTLTHTRRKAMAGHSVRTLVQQRL